jgi:hypothetical protein
VWISAAAAASVALWLAANWIYQVVRKPSELLFPMSAALDKTPAQTWQSYGPVFKEHATRIITPDLLAALAQTEGAGNPIARTYWRWSWSLRPFDVYRPASSSVGMYQMTDAAFADARRLCIRDHAVVRDDGTRGPDACGFARFYSRLLPGDAVQLTAAFLDSGVTETLARHHLRHISLRRQQHLATLMHLCGIGVADAYAQRGFRVIPGERCGDHDPAGYLTRVDALRAEFARLASRPE